MMIKRIITDRHIINFYSIISSSGMESEYQAFPLVPMASVIIRIQERTHIEGIWFEAFHLPDNSEPQEKTNLVRQKLVDSDFWGGIFLSELPE